MRNVVLLSGGLDSTTVLRQSLHEGKETFALSFDYNQRHHVEVETARRIAQEAKIPHVIATLGLPPLNSALTDNSIAVPHASDSSEIPVTYVPARNLVFLSTALGYAESIEAEEVSIGVSSIDYSGYPDCRPEFISAFQQAANIGMKASIQIKAPLVNLSKAQTIQLGLNLGVDYSKTHSCYDPQDANTPCRKCDSCRIRQAAFEELGLSDPCFST